MNRLLLCLFALQLGLTATGQRFLDGLWEGTLTEGKQEYNFELYLKKKGRKLTARTFLYLNDSTYVEMEANGTWHDDRSFNLYDLELVKPEAGDPAIYFRRTYQLLYRRSFNDVFMEGWWQEHHKDYNDEQRKLGRLYLKKVTGSKA